MDAAYFFLTFFPTQFLQSNVAWAYAKIGEWDPALFSAMAWKATQTMHAFTPQSIANFLWAYATLGKAPDAAFLRAAVAQSVPMLDQWAPQNLSNAAWSLAALRDEDVVKPVMPVREIVFRNILIHVTSLS